MELNMYSKSVNFFVFIFLLCVYCVASSSVNSRYGYVDNMKQDNIEAEGSELQDILALFDTSRNSDVRLDPDAKKDVSQLIVDAGYPMERYTVQTKDGFLLDVHRIPYGRKQAGSGYSNMTTPAPKPRPVVYLQHGLLTSAADWVMNFADHSLGFILADAGYDVWMGNSRGNTYSRRHVTLKPDEDKFWDWSFDEMAKYDTPTFIDFILTKTGQKSISYVGHSQGTIMAFAMFSTLPEYEKKVNLFVGLAPIITLDHIQSPIKYLSLLDDDIIYAILGRKDFLPNNELVKGLVDTVCDKRYIREVCVNVLFLLCGPDASNLNKTRLAVYLNHTPAGVSTKDMVHFSQMVRQKRFAMYDYGSAKENTNHYGQPTPPGYNASKITVPSVLFAGARDWLADPTDVETLKGTLRNIKAAYDFPTWNHLDFVYGINAGRICYDVIVKWLDTVR